MAPIVKALGWLATMSSFLAVLAGCTRIGPVETTPLDAQESFSHESFDRVLKDFVDGAGRVDYRRLRTERAELDHYCRLLERFGPDSHPELFPAESDRLAYWINAYNAAAIKAVLRHYPLESVLDVSRPWLFFFFPKESGFFYFQRARLGGKDVSLYRLENDVIRKRFREPRVHFALNCASSSCPKLPREAFVGERLEAQLQRETRKFLSDSGNFRIDRDRGEVLLSSIFDWYREDFARWYRANVSRDGDPLLGYVKLHLDEPAARELEEVASSYEVGFLSYDWRLNDRASFGTTLQEDDS